MDPNVSSRVRLPPTTGNTQGKQLAKDKTVDSGGLDDNKQGSWTKSFLPRCSSAGQCPAHMQSCLNSLTSQFELLLSERRISGTTASVCKSFSQESGSNPSRKSIPLINSPNPRSRSSSMAVVVVDVVSTLMSLSLLLRDGETGGVGMSNWQSVDQIESFDVNVVEDVMMPVDEKSGSL